MAWIKMNTYSRPEPAIIDLIADTSTSDWIRSVSIQDPRWSASASVPSKTESQITIRATFNSDGSHNGNTSRVYIGCNKIADYSKYKHLHVEGYKQFVSGRNWLPTTLNVGYAPVDPSQSFVSLANSNANTFSFDIDLPAATAGNKISFQDVGWVGAEGWAYNIVITKLTLSK